MATKRKRTKSSGALPGDRRYADLNAIFFDDGGGVSGFIEELIGVTAHGKDIAEARRRLTEAAERFLDGPSAGMNERMSAYGTVTRERLLVEVIVKRSHRPSVVTRYDPE